MALIQNVNIYSSDDENQLDNRNNDLVFPELLLSRIADNLLNDWVPLLFELGIKYRRIAKIQHQFPNDLYMQALQGLMQWKNSIGRKHVGSDDAVSDLLAAFKERERTDLINLYFEFKGNLKNKHRRKRCLETSESCIYKRKVKLVESVKSSHQTEVKIMELEYNSDVYDDTVNPSTSKQHYSHQQDEEKNSKTKGVSHTNQNLNNEQLTILVDHKSPLIPFGRNVRKPRIALLLSTGSEYIRASAFNHHAEYIDQNMENDMVYRISGYILKTSDYSKPDLELTLYKSTQIEVVSRDEIQKQAKTKFRIDDLKQKKHVKHTRTVGPVVVTSVGSTRQPLRKYLKEINLKDNSGSIILNIWSLDNNISFTYKRGDVLELQNVEVNMFKAYRGTEYTLTGDVIKFEQIHGYDMQDLLLNEDEQFLVPKTMKINNLHTLKKCKHLVYINFAKIEVFVKDSKRKKIFKHCAVDVAHGLLIENENGWYCEECGDYTEGVNKVKLTAEVVDAMPHSHSQNTVWVNLYDSSVQKLLGANYKIFLQTENENTKRSILRKCEFEDKVYRLELKFDPNYKTQSVKKLTVI